MEAYKKKRDLIFTKSVVIHKVILYSQHACVVAIGVLSLFAHFWLHCVQSLITEYNSSSEEFVVGITVV
jgi:hypothetical protein